jgi:hypothetical protein
MTQQMCKQKIVLLNGDARMLYDPAQKPLLDQMQSSPAYLAIKQRLRAGLVASSAPLNQEASTREDTHWSVVAVRISATWGNGERDSFGL